MDQAILTRFRTRSTTTERPKATATKTRAKPPSTASSPRTPRTRRTRSPTSTSRTSRTRPAELRPEHPALVPGPPLLQPGGLALLPAPLQGQVRSGHLGANPDRYRFIPVRGTTPRRTGTTPKRTARPRPSSTSSTSPGTRPRPSASSSGAPRTPPKQTCAKGQRDPETDEALNDILNWEGSATAAATPDRTGTLRGTDPNKAGAARASGVFAAVEGTQRDNQAAQQHSRAGYPIDRSSSGWEGTGAPKTTIGRTRRRHQCRGTPESPNQGNHLNSKADSCNRCYDWQLRWTRRLATKRAPRRLPALLSESGAAVDGSEILLECKILYIAWGTRPSPRTIPFAVSFRWPTKGQTFTFPRTSQDRQTE